MLDACADPRRPDGWIDADVRAAYTALHELGWVHSVEAWRDGRLAGGLYGVAIGGLFAGESMFHREPDASKVALLGLVDLLLDDHAGGRLLDVQWATDHLRQPRRGRAVAAAATHLARRCGRAAADAAAVTPTRSGGWLRRPEPGGRSR